ncbi:flagellar biosynthesis anti-sigma factor FlgM [Peribacillus glennii]|uniref:Negative regulator of flagellin synthesis n=1 Tax=Peribacillus glennii TaxID=2303991 RepID=A0A372LD81_9BACI|nr:flagellar biosynthesis anti-sigma factor FlgM [Peribacillus glennii]RFU63952.1 flagellar biosynthesis anti-sigma factor FlgM [Peribacillus glennii]
MKINNIGSSGVNPYNRQYNKIDKTKGSGMKADKLEISTQAKDLQHSSQIPEQRQARVEELKVQIENGTYKVDPRATAKSIIDFYFNK